MPLHEIPCGCEDSEAVNECAAVPCRVCFALRGELNNLAQYLDSAPHAEFDRNNVEALVRSLITLMDDTANAEAPVRWEALLGASGRIPRDVAICPECSRTLHYQVTAADEGGEIEVDLDCRGPMRTRWGDWTHRYWQSDWQETVDKCRAWVKAHAPNAPANVPGRKD